MTENELCEIRNLFLQLEKLIKKYGNNDYVIQLRTISNIIECIDSEMTEKEKTLYIINRYKTLYLPIGGLSDFYIHDDDFHARLKLNEPLDELKERLWTIMKQYL